MLGARLRWIDREGEAEAGKAEALPARPPGAQVLVRASLHGLRRHEGGAVQVLGDRRLPHEVVGLAAAGASAKAWSRGPELAVTALDLPPSGRSARVLPALRGARRGPAA